MRLWPAVVLVCVAIVALVVLWTIPETQRQQRYLRSASVILFTGFGLAVWLLLFSRLRWSVRLTAFGLVALLVGAAALSIKIRGVDGDLLPILEPRWKSRHSVALPAASPVPSTTNGPVTILADFPQFYGPNRNAVITGLALETNWTLHPPQLLWKQPVGPSWSGFVVRNGLAITLEQREGAESVIAYDLLSGRMVWTHTNNARYATTIAGEGPRSTPTIAGERVITFGASGMLNCLHLQSGKVLWSKDAARETDARVPDWGFTSSPLVVDGQVIIHLGGSQGRAVVAYDLQDGHQVWASGDGGVDYSSPIEAILLGTRQIVIFGGSIVSRDLEGKVLWSYPWPGGHPHITPPLIISSNQFFASTGYGTGCELVRVQRGTNAGWSATREWKTIALKSKFGPLFRVGNSIYGLDDGIFCCVNLENGERRWKDGRYGHGQGLLLGDTILLTSEKGELVLIRPDPEKLIELARFKVFQDKTWNPPALAGEYLLVRNDKEAACLKIKTR